MIHLRRATAMASTSASSASRKRVTNLWPDPFRSQITGTKPRSDGLFHTQPKGFAMTKKVEPDRHENVAGPALRTGKGDQGSQGVLKGHKEPGKQNPNLGDQGPHGGGEGVVGMQPGAGHPRGR